MKKRMKSVLLVMAILCVVCGFAGCRKPYDVPEFVTITPSQTAYLIPVVGDTADQGAFESEELLLEAKVATKEVQIPHRWVQTGRRSWQGEWRDSAVLIIVERKPVTREWTSDKNTGTSAVNQGIKAESKASITFSVSMNCTAQIDESDATKFLYRYNNKTLESIMDTEIRPMVEKEFVAECAKREMAEILSSKAEIMNAVESAVIPYFNKRGITITVLGLKGDVCYDDPAIQEAINAEFKATKEQEAQLITNETNISKAEADKLVAITKAEAEAEAAKKIQEALKASPQYIEYLKALRWDGKMPTTILGEGADVMVGLP